MCPLCQLSSLWADFVGECVCVCSLSVKLLVGRLRRGECVCVCSLSVKLLVSRLFKGVCVCVLLSKFLVK